MPRRPSPKTDSLREEGSVLRLEEARGGPEQTVRAIDLATARAFAWALRNIYFNDRCPFAALFSRARTQTNIQSRKKKIIKIECFFTCCVSQPFLPRGTPHKVSQGLKIYRCSISSRGNAVKVCPGGGGTQPPWPVATPGHEGSMLYQPLGELSPHLLSPAPSLLGVRVFTPREHRAPPCPALMYTNLT